MLSIILLILILGFLVFIHELGHFTMAKISKVHIYEFSIGMGPKIFCHKGKDKVDYCVRLLPIGGFVSMAGEVYEDDDKLPKNKLLCNKPWHLRFLTIIAGVTMNFILALVLLFVIALIWGSTSFDPIIGKIQKGSAISKTGIEVGDKIVGINDYKVKTWDKAVLVLQLKNDKKAYTFKVQKPNGQIKSYDVVPKTIKNEDGTKTKQFGFAIKQKTLRGFFSSLKYAFVKFGLLVEQMWMVIINLITGHLSLSALSGPVGMYSIVEESTAYGISQIVYLVALLSLNLGFINILPIPAFDGGRAMFMIIEKIKGSPINQKFENTCHTIGFILLMILMIIITINDIIKLF